jgi:hypothetical protein
VGAEEKLADREHGVERGRILEPPVRVPVDHAEGQQRRTRSKAAALSWILVNTARPDG